MYICSETVVTMKWLLILFTLSGLIASVNGQSEIPVQFKYSNIPAWIPDDTLYVVFVGETRELGVPCGYANQKGDTVIPIGRYQYCFFDTVTAFAIVGDTTGAYAIDREGSRLYEVYWFDNGIDYVRDGLFRILRNGKIGYANRNGEVVITPQFACANPFENGKAKVTYECDLIKEGESSKMSSSTWFYIDKTGKRID